MPTENINIETQVQSAITRSALLALIAANTVKKKIYHITDALSATATIAVFSRSTNQVSYNAMNLNTGKFGMYFITFDVFNPIIEGSEAVQSYVDNTYFPPTGNYNTVYLDLSTGIGYAWNGTTYFALSGGNVYEPTVGDFPLTGDADTLYIATDTGVMYLWDGSGYVALNSIPYIPLAGTVSGSPVTGDIERNPTDGVLYDKNIMSGDPDNFSAFVYYDDGTIGIYQKDIDGILTLTTFNSGTLQLASSNSNFSGIACVLNESNLSLDSFIPLKTMKSRIWTKAGTPTTSDDNTQGYIVGSLIWDTTNSILYKCTDNSTGAAVWETAIKSTLIDLIRTGTTIPTSVTRYATEGLAGVTTGLIVTICPNAVFTTFSVFITSAQSGTGSLTVNRNFYNVAGSLTDTQTLVIAAGSAAGIYTYSGATVDRTSVNGSYGIELINAATATSGNVNSIESIYYI